jgi:hypothetical protein
MGKKIKIGSTVIVKTLYIKDSIEIDLDDYPELTGLNNDELIQYISDNANTMKTINDKCDNLADELNKIPIIRKRTSSEPINYFIV